MLVISVITFATNSFPLSDCSILAGPNVQNSSVSFSATPDAFLEVSA